MRVQAFHGAILLFAAALGGCAKEGNAVQYDLPGAGISIAISPNALSVVLVALAVVAIMAIVRATRARRSDRPAPPPAPPPAFPVWIAEQRNPSDPDFIALQKYLADKGPDWPRRDAGLSDYVAAVNASPPDTNLISKEKLIALLGQYYGRWQQARGPNTALGQLLQDIYRNSTSVSVSTLTILLVSLLAIGLYSSSFLGSLAQTDHARGLITFLVAMVAVGVIMIGLIVVALASWKEPAEQFRAIKDIITIVVSVLGTILGFYFGSYSGDGATRRLAVTNVIASPSEVRPGQPATIRGDIVGGAPPYEIKIQFESVPGIDSAGMSVVKQQSGTSISESIKTPADVKQSTPFPFKVEIKDKQGAKAEWTGGSLVISPTAPAPASPTGQ